MSNQPVKSLEDLAKEVIDTQQGLSSLDALNVLFNPPALNPAPAAPVQPVVEPTPALTAVAPTAPVPVIPESPMGEPILNLFPDKFKDKDVQTSVTKMTKSYTDMEAELRKEKDEKANMQKILDSLSAPRSVTPAPIQAPQDDDIEDAQFFEKPKEMVAKMVERIAAQKILQYHADMERARYIEGFRTQHQDFDQMRGEILEVLAARPDLDKDQRNLPIVFEMARQLKVRKINDLKASLGLATPSLQPVQPASIQAQMPLDREKLKEELMEAIRAELQKRKSASGIQGGSAPVNPSDRLSPAPVVKPMTEEERILQEMMDSGPKTLSLNLA